LLRLHELLQKPPTFIFPPPFNRNGSGPRGPPPGLSAELGVTIPSCDDPTLLIELRLDAVRLAVEVEFMVPLREGMALPNPPPPPPMLPPPIDESIVSERSRSNTPEKASEKEALCGVDGTVACTAGPRAALCGVMGNCI